MFRVSLGSLQAAEFASRVQSWPVGSETRPGALSSENRVRR